LTRFISCYARTASKYAVFLLLIGTSLLFIPQAQANMGLQAYFYDNQTADNLYNDAPPIPPSTPMVFSIPVATVDQDFDSNPMPGLYEDFVVRYEGYITATESGIADLQCLADDGCIVIIDGVTVINEWVDKGMDGGVYPYTLVPNQSLLITVWYYENGGGAAVQLRWKLPTADWTIVPEVVFSPAPKLIPIVESPSETHTVVSETPTVVVDSPTVDTSDVPPPVSDSDTAVDTVTVSDTPTVIVDTSTTETETPQVIEETQTAELPLPQPEPLPTPVPVVVPEPIVVPAPVVVEPQPEPQPEPEPESSEPELDDELDLLDPEEELPVDEPQLPDEELSEYPVEEETNEIPSDPEIQEPIEPTPEPLPQPIVEPEPTSPPDIAPVTPINSEPMVTLDNGVVLTEEEAAAVVLLSNPAELLTELFTDPAAALAALGSVGSDMTEEKREESEKVVVSAIIAGGIATQSATAAAGAAAYRRKP
jgi:PA14 domain